MLGSDGVASVLTNWGQLLVRWRWSVGKPYRPVQSICAAVHDELKLHSTTLNPDALLPGFVSRFTDLGLSIVSIPITVPNRSWCSSARRHFGERFGSLLEREDDKSRLDNSVVIDDRPRRDSGIHQDLRTSLSTISDARVHFVVNDRLGSRGSFASQLSLLIHVDGFLLCFV